IIEIGSCSSKLECSSTSNSELSSYVSSYDESSSSDESGCLEKSVPGLMKMDVSQKGPSKDLSQVRVPPGTFTPSGGIEGSTGGFRDVNDQDEEEIDEDDDETDEQDDEIDEGAEDGKDDYDDELWSPKTIGTTTKKFISPKMKGASSNSTTSTKKLV
ncbi:hypothetical protein Tco_0043949, partial [Tanacetum coccineum]